MKNKKIVLIKWTKT